LSFSLLYLFENKVRQIQMKFILKNEEISNSPFNNPFAGL